MAGDGGAKGNTTYGYGCKARKVPGEQGDDGELTTVDLSDAEQGEAALCLVRRAARRWLGFDGAVRLEARQ